MRLKDRIAVVTGGGRGIGRAISIKLAREGADVVVASTSPEPAAEVIETIERMGREGVFLQTDVSDRDSVRSTFARVLDSFGRVDILVNNAGGSARGGMSRFCESEESTWDHVLGTNLKGVLYTCREVINPMLERRRGSIVNIASVAGMIGTAGQADYSAAKGAVIAFSQALAKETAEQGVRVNCVSPGPTSSDAGRSIPPEMREKLALQALFKATGFDRFAQPEDIANMAAFLASDDAQFVTGQNYAVCGLMNLGITDTMHGG